MILFIKIIYKNFYLCYVFFMWSVLNENPTREKIIMLLIV